MNRTSIVHIISDASLPWTINGSAIYLAYFPANSTDLLPQLCNGVDSFNVIPRNPDAPTNRNSPVSVVHLQLDCNVRVCSSGEQLVLTPSQKLCVPCSKGWYNQHAGSVCKQCPAGGVCEGGSHLAAQVGYWQWDDSFYKCNDNACCSKVSSPVQHGRFNLFPNKLA